MTWWERRRVRRDEACEEGEGVGMMRRMLRQRVWRQRKVG